MREDEMSFWLKKRGKGYPFITYRGGAMKSMVNFQIPLDEIGERFRTDKVKIAGKLYEKIKGKLCG